MTNNVNTIESLESNKNSSKFFENTKRAVRDVLIKTGMIANSMIPMSASSTPTVMSTSINNIPTYTIKSDFPSTSAELFTILNEENNEISPITDEPLTSIETGQPETNSRNTSETRADNQNNNIEYKALEINNIRPVDILPIIGQVEAGDKKVYEHIEHLRVAEATRIRDMMREYGAGNHSAEEYQELMNRLNTGMLGENPLGYNNYEIVGGEVAREPSNHASAERFSLNELIKHANFKVINTFTGDTKVLYDLCKNNSGKIYIMGMSVGGDVKSKTEYNIRDIENLKKYDKEKNLLVFCAGGNIGEDENGIILNKIYQEDYNLSDIHSVYSSRSRAHNKNDNTLDRHLMITFGTNKNGDIDQTNERGESSKFPIGFHNKVLFSGRAFPYKNYPDDKVRAEPSKYATSHTNYVNVAMADLCFQMFAEVEDVDKLLEMIRSTTLIDYIKLDDQTQELQLMNPAGFFQKYLMSTSLPTNLKTDETITLNKGYYHGVIYQIPGAEVNINGQWVAFTDNNKDLILSQNPMNLEWRLNGKLLNSYNYKPGDSINGQIIAVDDQWNGLNMTKDFSVNIEAPSSINSVTMPYTSDTWYTIDGIRLDAKPTKPGIYIINGQKVIIK